ncbi:hypothetical protein ACFO6R_10940 [Eubacterium multiforme]|uniref:Uncharacterized protein n=1 Tax=Eubacterium multiforme TaxID=83339 RepID=A0ABT9UVL0_9FIRM|nr:hypothetical protein [Eubacterium multiforme]MDQ0150311.1 hypothetical protein [Eubacterium multiforme]
MRYTEIELKEIFENENNFEAFKNFIEEFGLYDDFYDITSKHTEERLKALIAAEADGKKILAGKLLTALQESENKREALGNIYSNKEIIDDMDLEKLYNDLTKFMTNYKKHRKPIPHENQIIEKWMRELQNNIK